MQRNNLTENIHLFVCCFWSEESTPSLSRLKSISTALSKSLFGEINVETTSTFFLPQVQGWWRMLWRNNGPWFEYSVNKSLAKTNNSARSISEIMSLIYCGGKKIKRLKELLGDRRARRENGIKENKEKNWRGRKAERKVWSKTSALA